MRREQRLNVETTHKTETITGYAKNSRLYSVTQPTSAASQANKINLWKRESHRPLIDHRSIGLNSAVNAQYRPFRILHCGCASLAGPYLLLSMAFLVLIAPRICVVYCATRCDLLLPALQIYGRWSFVSIHAIEFVSRTTSANRSLAMGPSWAHINLGGGALGSLLK